MSLTLAPTYFMSSDAELWMIFDLDETTGEYVYYIPGFEALSDLTMLEPGEYYSVVVSAPCTLTILQ